MISSQLIPTLYELELERHCEIRRSKSKNPFFLSFRRYSLFSQSDEDSIVDEIIKRLNLKKGKFIELGVGNGLQNNTLNLLSKGWDGLWIGAEDISFKEGKRLQFMKKWITRENILEILKESKFKIDKKLEIDLLSIDLDGNDYYIWEELLRGGIHPKILIAEFNGILGSYSEWVMPYDVNFNWKESRSMYFGASFNSFIKLFNSYNYIPICCNTDTGVNLFFVKKEYSNLFKELENIDQTFLFEPPHYSITKGNKLHKSSPKLASNLSGNFTELD